jgi:hypothetical protein
MELKGELFGDVNEIFFGNVNKSSSNQNKQKIVEKTIDIDYKKTQEINDNKVTKNSNDRRVIVIKNSDLETGVEDYQEFTLTPNEELRFNEFIPKGIEFVNIKNGDIVEIVEKTKSYDGAIVYIVKNKETDELFTIPRHAFIGRNKIFLSKFVYDKKIEDIVKEHILEYYDGIVQMLLDHQDEFNRINVKGNPLFENNLMLEYVLEEPIIIDSDILIPDNQLVSVKIDIDLEYKILELFDVIVVDNKIVSFVLRELWL